jgi:hypothetical protein
VISEIRSRGAAGASDEFIELYNATPNDVALDTWQIDGRSVGNAGYTTRWKGAAGETIPAYGHFLIVGTAYAQAPAGDSSLTVSIKDAGSLKLLHSAALVDAVCYSYSDATLIGVELAGFVCEQTPVSNAPHDDSAAGNSDESIERKPGGASGNCSDTGDSAADFVSKTPATPENSLSPPTP